MELFQCVKVAAVALAPPPAAPTTHSSAAGNVELDTQMQHGRIQQRQVRACFPSFRSPMLPGSAHPESAPLLQHPLVGRQPPALLCWTIARHQMFVELPVPGRLILSWVRLLASGFISWGVLQNEQWRCRRGTGK